MNDTPSGGAPGQGGKEVQIGLPIRSVYDLSLARHHLKDILCSQAGQVLFLTGDAILKLEGVLSIMDSLYETVQMVEIARKVSRETQQKRRKAKRTTSEVRVGETGGDHHERGRGRGDADGAPE